MGSLAIRVSAVLILMISPLACRTSGGSQTLEGEDGLATANSVVLIGLVPARYAPGASAAGLGLLNRPNDGGQPSRPQDPEQPSQPDEPTNTQPEQPEQPGEATQPSQPTRPSDEASDIPAGYSLVAMTIESGIIRRIDRISEADANAREGAGTLILRAGRGAPFDVIYPGMINLHNHTKQNSLPVWGDAKGQFANRFEWRDWGKYKKAVSFNMNPWIDHPVTTCAAFRWSELQAMVLGTTYLQGPSSCIENFTIHQVEDGNSFMADPAARLQDVSAPTDLVVPEDMPFVWKHLRPLINDQGMTYEQALKSKVEELCPRLVSQFPAASDVMSNDAMNIFKDKAKLQANCDSDPDKFIRFLNWQHKTVAGKRKYLASSNHAALIVHLAEGRRNDPYNRIELDILRLFGLDLANVNLVHAVGVDRAGLEHMAQKKMGLIWSPFSNFLLYGETVDIKAAIEAGVQVAMGSDWTPTGSRGVLEELKVARAYVHKMNLQTLITDERLFEMVTETPAAMIHHAEVSPTDGRHGVGTIAVDAAASFVVMRRKDANPFTNFVKAEAKDVNLVMIDGRPLYGEVPYLKTLSPNAGIEMLPANLPELSALADARTEFPQIEPTLTDEEKTAKLADMIRHPTVADIRPSTNCGFAKGMIAQKTEETTVAGFRAASGANLDSPVDIQKILAIGLLTQSYNRNPSADKGDPNFAVKTFPALFSCDDANYSSRLRGFVDAETEASDELTRNRNERAGRRNNPEDPLGRGPKKMAELYNLPYDAATDY